MEEAGIKVDDEPVVDDSHATLHRIPVQSNNATAKVTIDLNEWLFVVNHTTGSLRKRAINIIKGEINYA